MFRHCKQVSYTHKNTFTSQNRKRKKIKNKKIDRHSIGRSTPVTYPNTNNLFAGAGGWSGVREKYCWLAGG